MPAREQSEPEATPRPWRCRQSQPGIWHIDHMRSDDWATVIACTNSLSRTIAELNARLIVRAVNNFDPLVSALRDLLDNPTSTEAQVRAAAVLAQAEGDYD